MRRQLVGMPVHEKIGGRGAGSSPDTVGFSETGVIDSKKQHRPRVRGGEFL
jgi:hypothetical protein